MLPVCAYKMRASVPTFLFAGNPQPGCSRLRRILERLPATVEDIDVAGLLVMGSMRATQVPLFRAGHHESDPSIETPMSAHPGDLLSQQPAWRSCRAAASTCSLYVSGPSCGSICRWPDLVYSISSVPRRGQTASLSAQPSRWPSLFAAARTGCSLLRQRRVRSGFAHAFTGCRTSW